MINIERMLPYERDLFLTLNHAHTPFWDSFMYIYSGILVWVPLALLVVFVICYKSKRNTRESTLLKRSTAKDKSAEWKETLLLILAIVLLATLTDQISAGFIKPYFHRLRPSHHPDFKDIVLLLKDSQGNFYRGGQFGFVSSHASNGFGIATFLALVFKNKRFTIGVMLWALIDVYTRIYLGVHFISDIVGGTILGLLLGSLTYSIYQYFRYLFFKMDYYERRIPIYSPKQSDIIVYGIIAMNISIAIYSAIAIC